MIRRHIEPEQWKESVGPVALYRRDLEDLVTLVGDAKLIVDCDEYDNIDDLKAEHGTRIKNLKVVAYDENGRVATAVNLGTNAIITTGDRIQALTIREFLNARPTTLARHTDSIDSLLFALTVCGLVTAVALLDPDANGMMRPWQLLLLPAIYYLMLRFTSKWRRQCSISMLLKHEHRTTTFFGRNKDKFIVEVGKVLLGGIIGWLLGIHFGG